jgi:hypothetical protein
MAKDFKKLKAQAHSVPSQRVAIPQIDPGESSSPLPKSGGVPQPALQTETPAEPVIVAGDPRALPIPKGEVPQKMSWHMYPSRHRQVLYEAFMTGDKPWEINERALAEYFERHHGKKK